jgi:integration host factor subunit beta
VSVPEKRLPFFKVGKELKALVNQGMPSQPGDVDIDDDEDDEDDDSDE